MLLNILKISWCQVIFFIYIYFWLCHAACRVLLPQPGMSLCPFQGKCGFLTTGLTKFPISYFFKSCYLFPVRLMYWNSFSLILCVCFPIFHCNMSTSLIPSDKFSKVRLLSHRICMRFFLKNVCNFKALIKSPLLNILFPVHIFRNNVWKFQFKIFLLVW